MPGIPAACLPLYHEYVHTEARAVALGRLAAAALTHSESARTDWHRGLGKQSARLGLEAGELAANTLVALPERAAPSAGALPPATVPDALLVARARLDAARDNLRQREQELADLGEAASAGEREQKAEAVRRAVAEAEAAGTALSDLEGQALGGAAVPVAAEIAAGLAQRLRTLLSRTRQTVAGAGAEGVESGLLDAAEALLNLRLNVLTVQQQATDLQAQAAQAQQEAMALKIQLDNCIIRHAGG